ncbi:MAG: thioesterase, partial [Sphingomonadales bacterium 39-62-4]
MGVNNAIPHLVPISVDPADIDFMGHVNNASYLKWVQDA